MENDYISIAELEKWLMYNTASLDTDADKECFVERIREDIPAADVCPVKRGEWETALLDHEAFGVRPKVLYCSECHTLIAYKTNFCPNCGADMTGGAD